MRDYKVKTIRALDRGLEVLSYLHRARAASLHDLFLATGLPKATLTRVIVTLEKRGMVWQRLADGAYMASHTLQPRAPQLSDENYLVEVAASVMERLCRKVNWPSVLAVPRLDCMEVIETNRPKSYFSHVPVGPIGFRINMLRSATGRAYIAFCSESERQAMLQRLAASAEPGNYMARKPAMVERLLDETRRLGYGHRTPDFGGHFDQTRREWNDDRDSIAVPIFVGDEVIASLNMTWMHKVATVPQIVKAHLPQLTAAAREISMRLVGT
jgi:IclR family transcriptional regulator, mhp operon transcriptional activator